MIMSEKKSAKISTLGSRLTSIVSVTLVLIILGILAMTLEASRRLSDDIRQNMGFVVKLVPASTDVEVNRVKQLISRQKGISKYTFASAESILDEESKRMGENVAELLDQNPFGAEFEIKMKAESANGDSIARISEAIASDEAVEEIVTETAVVDSVNAVLKRLSIILVAVAVALLIISFVLINNTVSLAIYARRFLIHTMKLVGATGSFIRRPFIWAGVITGAVAGVVAAGLLAAIRAYSATFDPIVDSTLPWPAMGAIFAVIVVLGILICALASIFATNRYLRATYDQMFRK